MSFYQLIIVFIIGLIAGFMSAVSGGGGLLSIPLLLFLGIPPQVTLATNKFGGLGGALGGTIKYFKEKKIHWNYVLGLSIAGFVASFIGSRVLLTTSQESLNKLIGVLLLLLVSTLFIKKDFGLKRSEISNRKKFIGYTLYFFLSIVASFFGGVGLLTIATVAYFFGLPIIEANATEYISFLILSVTAVIIYMINGIVDYPLGITLFISMLVGGYVGAHTAIKKGNEWVKFIFALVIIASAIKVLV